MLFKVIFTKVYNLRIFTNGIGKYHLQLVKIDYFRIKKNTRTQFSDVSGSVSKWFNFMAETDVCFRFVVLNSVCGGLFGFEENSALEIRETKYNERKWNQMDVIDNTGHCISLWFLFTVIYCKWMVNVFVTVKNSVYCFRIKNTLMKLEKWFKNYSKIEWILKLLRLQIVHHMCIDCQATFL